MKMIKFVIKEKKQKQEKLIQLNKREYKKTNRKATKNIIG